MCNYREDLNNPNHTTVVVGGQTLAAGRGYQPVTVFRGPTDALKSCDQLSQRIASQPAKPQIEDRREVPATGAGTPPSVFQSLEQTSRHIHALTGKPRFGG